MIKIEFYFLRNKNYIRDQFFTAEKEAEMSDDDDYYSCQSDDDIIATQGSAPEKDHFSSGVLARFYQETGKQMPDCTYAAVKARRELEETKEKRKEAFLEAQARAAEAAQARTAAEAAAQAQARAAAAEAEAAAQARAAAAEAPAASNQQETPPCYRDGDSLQMNTSEGAAPPPYTASIGETSV